MFSIYFCKFKKIRPLVIIKWRTLFFNFLIKIGAYPNLHCNGSLRVMQSLNIQGRGKVSIANGCMLGVFPSPDFYRGELYIEARHSTSEVNIGERVYINNNAMIIADKSSINIGNDTLIGPNFICFDSNFHPLSAKNRLSQNYNCKPIYIGNNCFIGANVTVLKGVTIGDNSVIGSGAIIDFDIEANVVVKVEQPLKVTKLR
jgi:maltose O-acetyltransferase